MQVMQSEPYYHLKEVDQNIIQNQSPLIYHHQLPKTMNIFHPGIFFPNGQFFIHVIYVCNAITLTCSHSTGGPVTCKDCGRVFKRGDSLVLHRKVHEGLTTCSICGSVSSRVAHLRAHLRIVHKLTREEIMMLVPLTRWRRSTPDPPPS